MLQKIMPSLAEREDTRPDPRWNMLGLVQSARDALALKDRDITVLRGLLSLISAEHWRAGAPVMVYASNRVLIERCDGIEERTLRRRLAHLCEIGLIRRHISPNRKRYALRDSEGAMIQSYGFDLAPLRMAEARLQNLAEEAARVTAEIKLLRKVLRDRLWRAEQAGLVSDKAITAHLRNKTTPALLRAAIESLDALLPEEAEGSLPAEDVIFLTDKMSDSDSQNVRDIQSSNKEIYKKEALPQTLDLETCLEKAPEALDFAPNRISTWRDLSCFMDIMGPALNINPRQIHQARHALGEDIVSLAILGLVQAGNRIQQPMRYFQRLVSKGMAGELDVSKMFNSLTRNHKCAEPPLANAGFPAGNLS